MSTFMLNYENLEGTDEVQFSWEGNRISRLDRRETTYSPLFQAEPYPSSLDHFESLIRFHFPEINSGKWKLKRGLFIIGNDKNDTRKEKS